MKDTSSLKSLLSELPSDIPSWMRATCKESFRSFVKFFWEQIPGAGKCVWNWHLDVMCEELQDIAERVFRGESRKYDLICNQPFGMSKSSIFSILFNAWVWTRMPQARFLTGSHTDKLTIDLSTKTRAVITSDLYRACFPEVKLSDFQSGKEYFTNTYGGDRNTCTVGGKTPMGFHAHFLICLPKSTRLLTRGGPMTIGEIVDNKSAIEVRGYDHNLHELRWQRIFKWEKNPGSNLWRVVLTSGFCLKLTESHPVYVVEKAEYVPASKVVPGDTVLCEPLWRFGTVGISESAEEVPEAVYNVGTYPDRNYFAEGILVHNCDDPIDPQGAISEAELDNADRFISEVLPSRKVDKAVSVTILVMQRIHYRDPTAVMQREAKKEGAAPIRQICLPGEIEDGSNVFPPELKEKYTDGLLDTKRLPYKVLNEYRARGALFYATQVQQRPYPPTGGMFQAKWFQNLVKAAPYHAVRVRGWDRAASTGPKSARTAGVLMAMTRDPLNFYVEDIVAGHWEPDERNARMLATARKDRARYGPGAEPIIIVEMEGGSSGRDAWKGVARALAGFPIFEERVTGSKDVRAEPWAAQLAAQNVYMVDDGTWDIPGAVLEHLQFIPESGRLTRGKKDIVDSCSLCFNYLINRGGSKTGFRVMPRLLLQKKKGMRIAVMTPEELLNYDDDAPALITFVADLPVEKEVMSSGENNMRLQKSDDLQLLPSSVDSARSSEAEQSAYIRPVVGSNPTGPNNYPLLERPIDCYTVYLADLDPAEYQDKWLELVEPWQKLPEDLVMTREHGKKIWAFLTKKRLEQTLLWVFVGKGRAPISLALAAADAYGLDRNVIYWPDKDVNKDTKPSNDHIYRQLKFSRNLVAT